MPRYAVAAAELYPPVVTRCPGCAEPVATDDRFCEACGRELRIRRTALPHNDFDSGPCEGCQGPRFDGDGYCVACGLQRRTRDRFEADLGAVYLITDRGLVHAHNEDAVSAAVLDDPETGLPAATVIVVCDGVSTSEDPQSASGGAARTGVEVCLAALAADRTAEEAALAGLEAAAQAVRALGTPGVRAPSCTYVSAVVRPEAGGVRITIANVGDSRAYWLADTDTDPSRRLTVDDSLAQAFIATGEVDERTAMNMPGAHTLTRWLGADSPTTPWSAECVRSTVTTTPGVLLVCSDGLWNYLPDAADLARLARVPADSSDTAALREARALVDFALGEGGSDNITVALVPVPFFDHSGVPQ